MARRDDMRRAGAAGLVCGLYALSWWHQMWVDATREFREAAAFAASSACRNATINQLSGRYGLECRKAQHVIQISPFARSLHGVLEAFSLCGRNRCEQLYYDVVANLSWLVLGLACITSLALRFLTLERAERRLTLPTKQKLM